MRGSFGSRFPLARQARALLQHVGDDVGAAEGFFEGLLDAPPFAPAAANAAAVFPAAAAVAAAKEQAEAAAAIGATFAAIGGSVGGEGEGEGEEEEGAAPSLCHSLVRVCRYREGVEGVYGSNVLCEAHNDVGFITLDPCAATSGLQALRRSDNMWVPVEEVAPRADGALVLMVMVGDTLGRVTGDYYAPCRHRVVAPPAGERIGLPFLFRGRSDAVRAPPLARRSTPPRSPAAPSARPRAAGARHDALARGGEGGGADGAPGGDGDDHDQGAARVRLGEVHPAQLVPLRQEGRGVRGSTATVEP